MRLKLIGVAIACTALASCYPVTTPPSAPATPTTSTTVPALAPRLVQPAPSSSAPATPTCSIRSDAGNCYRAGEFCPVEYVGQFTTDAENKTIVCALQSNSLHWQYPPR